MGHTDTKEHAHELIDRMAPGQVSAVVSLMEILLDPVARSLANAPYDDEPVSDEEARDIAEARAAYARGEVVSNEEVLADFGLNSDDFERMGRTHESNHGKQAPSSIRDPTSRKRDMGQPNF